ncbi:MAG: NUDIX domain-containing protein [Candidatus Pacebacteria bacterium]|nr:NUDIX domain-containing protein [Candidatus Paceibacterota bacterium]
MYRKGVSSLIINEKQEFLIVNLISFEEKYFAIPGGGSEINETLEETTYREIKEELGIEKESLKFINKSDKALQFKFKEIKLSRDGIEYEGSEKYFFGFKFIGNEDEIKLPEDEVRSYKWVSYYDLKNYLLFDNQLKDTQEKIKEIFFDIN